MAEKPKNGKNTKKKICNNCKKELALINFYTSSSPMFDGKTPLCKKCIKELIDYDDMKTIYSVLQTMDTPFLCDVWETVKSRKGDAFGNYMRMINSLPQYSSLRWNDSGFNKDNTSQINLEEEDKITTYDKQWRGSYSKNDLEYLNDYFKRLQNDFNIVTVNHLDYAKKIAKASLAMDKAYDGMLKGESGASKSYKDLRDAFDNLCKSAQFSESTRGATSAGINGITEVVDKVETKEWIEEVSIEEFPEDQLDHLLLQFSNIEKSL